jgi:hypothetical protein
MSNNFQAGLVGNSLHGSEINQPLGMYMYMRGPCRSTDVAVAVD